jgi:hypothetical protein
MARYTVRQGHCYRAKIRLGFVESWADNETVADRIRKAGFTEVKVTGSGRTREATGLWPLPDAAADLPDQVINPIEV